MVIGGFGLLFFNETIWNKNSISFKIKHPWQRKARLNLIYYSPPSTK